MWIIQSRDLSEGNGALWSDFSSTYDDRDQARRNLAQLIAMRDNEDLTEYRLVPYKSDQYYSQPTDRLEW